ncbi:snoRNP complex protein nop56 [Tulasnella sp. JGI-2019a]|nr:snoRNP complex protein nop56 [Tulasnella sp. JGI-2019a]KAG9035678.1 snoRNP complex protein nop56 [Tulasnella sp. JGI-2019a]
MATHILFESASGYAIFEVNQVEEIGAKTKEVQATIQDVSKFSRMVTLKSFDPFKSAADALQNINDISEGVVNDHLKALLELNLSKSGKKSKKSAVVLGVSDRNLAASISSDVGIGCDNGERTLELIRGIRLHAEKLLEGLQEGDVKKAQLGLGHSYSRAKVKFNVNKSDNMIIQAIALLDQLDKDVNTFAMRVREWYGWHFPELATVVPDNYQYARAAKLIENKSTFDESKLEQMAEILDNDETRAKNVLDAARASMGTDMNGLDAINVLNFAQRTIELSDYRKSLTSYLAEKMDTVAPSLTALIGERIGARLISHAGSIVNLSKYPASTIQILGAEKALFRALKTKGNTPKYGLIFNSGFISRAGPKHKGRISRFLANKCAIASRIDAYSTDRAPTNAFGEALKKQVEERLTFFETGAPPTKNSDAMRKVMESLSIDDAEMTIEETPAPPKDKKKKRKADAMEIDDPEMDEKAAKKAAKEEKRRKKEEKRAKRLSLPAPPAANGAGSDSESDAEVSPKKKEKKEKKDKKHKVEANGEPEKKKRRKSTTD